MEQAYILVAAKSGKIEEVIYKLSKIKNIRNIERVQGEYDLVAEIVSKDNNSLENIMQKNIKRLKEVGITSTLILKK